MRLQRQHALVFACASFVIASSITAVRAAGETATSTLRTVSISSPPTQAAAPVTLQTSADSGGSQARFTRATVEPAATPITTASQREASSARFATATASNVSRPTSTQTPSSLVVVTSGTTPKQPEREWVRQARYESTGPAIQTSVTEQSSITIEPIGVELAGPAIASATEPAPAPRANEPDPAPPAVMQAAHPVVVTQQTPARLAMDTTAQPAPQLAAPPVVNQAATNASMPPLNQQIFEQLQARQPRESNFGGAGRATLSQMPQRAPIRPATSSTPHQKAKPYQGVQSTPTVSPYLNLYRDADDGESAPNYYAFVRPQLEQQEANRGQQLELQRLQRQLQNTTVAAPQYRATATPETGTAARFMDTAQFFSGWQH